LQYDLAIDASGAGRPSMVDAGLVLPDDGGSGISWAVAGLFAVGAAGIAAIALSTRGMGMRNV
jgi:hypothetical protein